MNAPVDRAALAAASLDDKYTLERGRVFLTGTQALIRLMMLQRERDSRAGLNTAGFVSGYRGSPLGGLDQALWRAKQHLESHHVRFQLLRLAPLRFNHVEGSAPYDGFPEAEKGRQDELRARHAKKPSLLARLDRAGLPASAPTGPIRQSV